MSHKLCDICFELVHDEDMQEHLEMCLNMQYEELEKLNLKVKLNLTSHQKTALEYCNAKAQEYSDRDYPLLVNKFRNKGLDESDLHLVINYIQNITPIIIHLKLDTILEHLCDDIYYRNQFQTSTSNGLLSYQNRISWEKRLFNDIYKDDDGFNRVKYGPLNITNSPNGVNAAIGYGDSYLLLKNEIKNRTTLTFGDSSNQHCEIATFNNLFHILNKLNDDLLNKIIKLSTGDDISFDSNYGFYLECQYHGEILLERDLEAIVINKRHKNDTKFNKLLIKFANRHKCCVVWMD